MRLHPTAIIDRHAEIDPSAEVGAYAVVEAGVQIGPGCRIWHHACVCTGTTLAARVQVHPFAVVGHHPQDLAWKGEPSCTRVDEDTIIREHATVHRGTMPGSSTVIGRRCLIMATGHVGHNCVLGDEVKVANGALLSGHVQVGDRAFVSGNAVVHQFVRIGELAMIGGGIRVPGDVLPFMLMGPDGLMGPNTVGLRRAGFSAEQRTALREAFRLLFRSGLGFRAALERLAWQHPPDPLSRLVAFAQAPSRRGLVGAARRRPPLPGGDPADSRPHEF